MANSITKKVLGATIATGISIAGIAAAAPDAHAVRFVNDKTSTRSIYALKSKHGFVYTVRPGARAPKGTKYVRVLRNNVAKYWGWDERAHPKLKEYRGPVTKRQKIKRTFYTDFEVTQATKSTTKAILKAGFAPANPDVLFLPVSNFKPRSSNFFAPASNYGNRH